MSKKLPFVQSDIPRDLRMFLDRVRELVSGSGSDRLISLADVVDAGIGGADGKNNLTLPPSSVIVNTPPPPTGLTASGAIQNVVLTWDAAKYAGHAFTEIWGSSTNTIGTAVLLGQAPGVTYSDALGPGTTRYYWIRFKNTNDEVGPYNAVVGVAGTTGQEVPHLLDVLTGQLQETQLYSALGSRLNLIDGSGAGSVNARIAVEATTRSTETGALFAQYAIKIDNNGYVSGFGLASTANNATPYSEFAIRADKFYIASPSGPGISPIIPFVVTTTPTTVNGVAVPVGIYMDAAYIKNGTITNAKIGDATIDSAKINSLTANKITAGAISTGEYIQSSNYVAGTSGWRINGSGAAEFAAAAIRDKVLATQIDARGLTILDTSGNAILTAGASVSASTFSGNVNGNVAGVAASTVKDNAANALTNAATAQTTANTAVSAAATAQATADSKLARSGSQILTGPVTLNAASAFTVGNPALNGVAGRNGFYIGSTGIVGTKDGSATFTLDNDGNALFKGNLTGATGTFSGSIAVGSSPAVSGETMTGTGAKLNADGTFAMGTADTNISFNGTKMSLNGNVVGNRNLLPGASVPDIVLTSTSGSNYYINFNNWTRITFDNYFVKNQIGAVAYGDYFTLPAGTYYYELSVGNMWNGGSDGNEGVFTALALQQANRVLLGYSEEDGTPYYNVGEPTILSYAGATRAGDWQYVTAYGVNRIALANATNIMIVAYTNDYPNIIMRPPGSGYTSSYIKIWRDS